MGVRVPGEGTPPSHPSEGSEGPTEKSGESGKPFSLPDTKRKKERQGEQKQEGGKQGLQPKVPDRTPPPPPPPPSRAPVEPVAPRSDDSQSRRDDDSRKEKDGSKQTDDKSEAKKKQQQQVAERRDDSQSLKKSSETEQMESAEEVVATEQAAQVDQISALISKMVGEMKIGTVGGKDILSAKLEGADVPETFMGSNVTLSYKENALVIKIENFETPQLQQKAIHMVEQNKQQLTQLVQNLQAKNIHLAELSIGNHTVALPRVEPLPPPFQTPPSAKPQEERGEEHEREGEEEKEQE